MVLHSKTGQIVKVCSGYSDPSHFNRRIPDLMDTDPVENAIKFKVENLSALLLIIGFRSHRENNIKTGKYNKETNFNNLTDPKACFTK